jgi:type VI secretion system protein ImpJ
MTFLRPLRWKEGLFLRPHHLQQLDLFLESRDIGYLMALEHFGWGLVRCEFQDDSLNNFVLAIKSLRAVLPEGTLVDLPGNARLPARRLDRKAYDAARPLDVAVGLRRLEDRRPLAAPDGSAPGQARFKTVTAEVYDLDAGRDPTTVEQAEYDMQFFVGEEPTSGFETIPVARLLFTGDPSRPLQHAPIFSPPCLALGASHALLGSVRAVVEQIAKALREKSDVRGTDKTAEIVWYQLLAMALPVLRDMVRDGMVHPRRVYQELCRLAGGLYFRDATGKTFDDIPEYSHSDPGPGFEQLRALIYLLSEMEIVRRYRKVSMERAGDRFKAALPPEGKLPGARFFLEVEAAESSPKVKGLIAGAKISAPARIETLQRFVLPGIATEAQPGPPAELPPGQTGSYFRLKVEEGTEWGTSVLPAGSLDAFLLGAGQDIRITLVIILPGR